MSGNKPGLTTETRRTRRKKTAKMLFYEEVTEQIVAAAIEGE
jgi:hypothetical protein